MQYNYRKKMFTRKAKLMRVTGDPDEQWSSSVLYCAMSFWGINGHYRTCTVKHNLYIMHYGFVLRTPRN